MREMSDHSSRLKTPVALALVLCLKVTGWATEKPADQCCDQSSMECNTGQNVGDKGSCSGSEVCVQFADHCKKKHPGVFCTCGEKQSSLMLSSTNLIFDKKSRNGSFTVSNAGNVPLS